MGRDYGEIGCAVAIGGVGLGLGLLLACVGLWLVGAAGW